MRDLYSVTGLQDRRSRYTQALLLAVKELFKRLLLLLSFVAALTTMGLSLASAEVKGAYLYTLSNFTGPIPYFFARVRADRPRNEVYVLYQNLIRVFNDNGMEVYSFGDDVAVGHVIDVAVDEGGDILLLSYDTHDYKITACDYRGVPMHSLTLKDMPPEFSGLKPSRLVFFDDKLYFAGGMQIMVTRKDGSFVRGYDIISILKSDDDTRDYKDDFMVGFNVDRRGNIIFSLPTLFKVYVISPEGKVSSFGKVGGPPGRFGIIAGVAGDNRGNYLVADKLKHVVAVFDKDFNFVGEFGYIGAKPGNLVSPDDIAVDGKDRVYVSQGRNRGVSVFQLTYD